VHRFLGPGLFEVLYDAALCIESDERGIKYARQVKVPAFYKGRSRRRATLDHEFLWALWLCGSVVVTALSDRA
jgi:GxxExxY protein